MSRALPRTSPYKHFEAAWLFSRPRPASLSALRDPQLNPGQPRPQLLGLVGACARRSPTKSQEWPQPRLACFLGGAFSQPPLPRTLALPATWPPLCPRKQASRSCGQQWKQAQQCRHYTRGHPGGWQETTHNSAQPPSQPFLPSTPAPPAARPPPFLLCLAKRPLDRLTTRAPAVAN